MDSLKEEDALEEGITFKEEVTFREEIAFEEVIVRKRIIAWKKRIIRQGVWGGEEVDRAFVGSREGRRQVWEEEEREGV